jgi:argininosuccinate lyase
MSRLWDKGAPLDAQIAAFTVGDDPIVDLRFARHDVLGSAAHVHVQRAAGLLDAPDAGALLAGLAVVLADIDAGRFTIPFEQEDVHTAVESLLTERLGPVAGRLHTGRSRNDQVLTAVRRWLLDELDAAEAEIGALAVAWLDFAERHGDRPLPGYTHLQPAMPSSFGLWAGGYAGALLDTLPLLAGARALADRCPLGSAAGYGSPLPLDRALAARLLGFSAVEAPVTAPQLTRGLVEAAALHALAAACHIVARWAWDVTLYASSEFSRLRLPDAFTTGSSIMPQKRNPDVAELLRTAATRVRAAQRELEDLSGHLPGGYHRDLQHTKAPLVRGLDAGRAALRIAAHLAPALEPLDGPMDDALYATSEAFRRASESGRPFREVYRHVGLEVKAGTFVTAERAPAPGVDIVALRARLPAPRPPRAVPPLT